MGGPANLRTLSLVAAEMGGMRRLLALRRPSEERACSPEWTILARLYCALKVDQSQDWRCPNVRSAG